MKLHIFPEISFGADARQHIDLLTYFVRDLRGLLCQACIRIVQQETTDFGCLRMIVLFAVLILG